MKIAIIGAGAIGSIAAAYLHKAGQDVVLIGKEDQVKAIRQLGLKISGVRGEETFKLNAASKLETPVDLIIFTTKTQDLEAAYQHNNEYLDDGLILTSQNGVQADNILSVHVDKDSQLSSIVMFGATYVKPGEVTFNFEGDWIIGKPFRPVGPKVHEIAEVLGSAFKTVISQDIVGMKWTKLFVNFNNCIPAAIGRSMQETFADLDFCRLSVMLLKEGVRIVKKANIELVSLPNFTVEKVYGLAGMPLEQAAGIINQTLTRLSDKPLYGSILQSIMRGKLSEIDFINGEIVQLAVGIKDAAPLNDRIVAMVHEVENTGKFLSVDDVKNAFQLTEEKTERV